MKSIQEIDHIAWLLQEDGDPSYDMEKRGLAEEYEEEYKEAHNIQNLKYSAESPGLNSIKGISAGLKQRLRRRIFDTEEELKEALQEE